MTLRRSAVLFSIALLLGIASIFGRPRISPKAGAPLLAGAEVPTDVMHTLERSCRDCHSEATTYPWYSFVAPVEWLIASDVSRGRGHLNMTEWQTYSLVRRERLLSEIANQVRDGDMPLWQYLIIHRGARLSQADVDAIFRWTQAERMRLIEGGGKP